MAIIDSADESFPTLGIVVTITIHPAAGACALAAPISDPVTDYGHNATAHACLRVCGASCPVGATCDRKAAQTAIAGAA